METEEFIEKELVEEAKDLDELEDKPVLAIKLEDFFILGKYTLFICVMVEFMILIQLGNMFYMMYVGAEPGLIRCGDTYLKNLTDRNERCAAYYKARQESNCVPELDIQFNSVNSDWNYICLESRQVKKSISWQMLAVIPGSVLFGQLSDLYGRRKIMLVTVLFCTICMVITSFTVDLFWFTIWRSLVQFFNGGLMAIQMVYMVENLPKNHRFWLTNLITWSPNMLVFAFLAWITGSWHTLARVSAILAVPGWILLFFLYESPRFLIQKHKMEEAKTVLRKIAKIDGTVISEESLGQLIQSENSAALETQKKKKKYSFIHLFYTSSLARYTVALAFSLLTTSMLNYSLLFNMEKLSGSIYLNSVFMGLFRFGVNIAAIFADKKWQCLGRKTMHLFAEVVSIIGLSCLLFIFYFNYQFEFRTPMAAIIIGVMGMTTLLYVTTLMLMSELFPTGIRNISFSFGQVFSRVGVVISPQIFFLADIWSGLPYALMLVIVLFDIVIFHFNTHETKGKAMRDHMPPKKESWLYRKRVPQELLDLGEKKDKVLV